MKTSKIMRFFWFIVFISLVACGESKETSPVIETPQSIEAPGTEVPVITKAPGGEILLEDFQGEPLAFEKDNLFAAAGVCTGCHTNMVDELGQDVSIDRMWRASMMANAARDPYWQAAVRSEVLDAPALRDVIEDKCAICHVPMAAISVHATGGMATLLDNGLLAVDTQGHALAMDGVSCNLCHQIDPDNFGQIESFSGHFLIDYEKPAGERISYGPWEVEESLAKSMQGGSGFIPVQSPHLAKSEMCATCHNLYTPYLNADGEIAGEFPEQVPYQEWENSKFKDDTSCQDCHMPLANGGVQLSILTGPKRSPFGQHSFVGSNTYILKMLRTFGEELGVTASSEHYDDEILVTEKVLKADTAKISLRDLRIDNGKLIAKVNIENLVGHKLPTSYPSRRVWLHITIRDSAGVSLFESGAYLPDGSIVGNDNDADSAKYEPHYTTLSSPEQVQIYEPIMINTEGEVTTGLLRGAAYIKDNRLLPLGFDKTNAAVDVAVYGNASTDEDFLAGGDVLNLEIDLGGTTGPFTIHVEFLYQSIAYRWAQNLAEHASATEIATFLNFYQAVANLPVVLATVQGEVK